VVEMKRIIFLLLILPCVFALNLGSLVKNDYAELEENQTASFEIIIWSKDENYTIFLQEKNYPNDWLISINPKVVSSKDKEAVYVNVGESYVRAHKINVVINPMNPKPGDYMITLSASAYQPEEKINVIQEREFSFKVKILGNATNTSSSITRVETGEKLSQPLKAEKVESKKWILTIIIITAVIVFLIIKY
jgi:hypothetical protein